MCRRFNPGPVHYHIRSRSRIGICRMKRAFFHALLCVAVMVVSAATPASAQVGCTLFSLEWLAADADVIVRGTISDISREVGPKLPGRRQRTWVVVTLTVEETLKGEAVKSHTFALDPQFFGRRNEHWLEEGQEQLWFLVWNKSFNFEIDNIEQDVSRRYPLSPHGSLSLIRLGGDAVENSFNRLPPPILTMQLTTLAKPEEIVKAVRATIADDREPEKVKNHSLMLPRELAQRSGRSGDVNHLVAPVDHRLEALAKRLIAAPQEFFPEDELAGQWNREDQRQLRDAYHESFQNRLRGEGVKALAHFKSDENVALLKPLLDDPAWHLRSIERANQPARDEREYYIRKAAYETLQAWDVDVAKPVLIDAETANR